MDKRLSRDQLEGVEVGRSFIASGKKYVLQGKLGDGAIGIVRKAVNVEKQSQVAVKFLAPEPKYIEESSIEDIYRRFKREGERGIGLDHDNLVEVISYQENQDGSCFTDSEKPYPSNPFLLMEYVKGRTLEDYLKKDKDIPHKSFNMNLQTISIAYYISRALAYLHKRGLVHRDVKPANIFLSKTTSFISEIPSAVKLGDFGIVKWNDFKATLTTGTLTTMGQRGLGTIKYMASEQSLDPKNVGVQSDMYSFGITLFELFTNQVLPDVHHVFQLRELRLERSDLDVKLYKLGLGPLPPHLRSYSYFFDLIFDCFLKSGSRPTSAKFEGVLKVLFDNFRTN